MLIEGFAKFCYFFFGFAVLRLPSCQATRALNRIRSKLDCEVPVRGSSLLSPKICGKGLFPPPVPVLSPKTWGVPPPPPPPPKGPQFMLQPPPPPPPVVVVVT